MAIKKKKNCKFCKKCNKAFTNIEYKYCPYCRRGLVLIDYDILPPGMYCELSRLLRIRSNGNNGL